MPGDRYLYRRTNSFLRSYKRYCPETQQCIDGTLEAVYEYLETGRAAYGLRIKSLGKRIYEARVDIHIRVAYYKGKDIIKFFCLGNHDNIQTCLKNLMEIVGSGVKS